MESYNPQQTEKKWQEYWKEHPELYTADDKGKGDKVYILDMFPYPSGDGLHVGHVESYTATDIISRYWRLNGKNVLHPQGWDAFGLPAENFAIKTKIHPSVTTQKAIANFKSQMNMLGISYDWFREINSSDPEYYKWTQWFFLLLYKNGLAYKSKAKVNWCESCQTVLANEQAEGGICERCKNAVVQKDLEQWFFKITDFIEDKPSFAKASDGRGKNTAGLISGLDKIDWPESTKLAQKNWIGKSEGAQFEMKIKESNSKIEVFTTRVDTVFGMTYVVVAPEHPILQELKTKIENWSEVEKYIEESKKKNELERTSLEKEKTGVELKGIKLINPFNNEEIPLFVGDYVLGHYGTGAVMAVPAHDERDFEFAKKHDLKIIQSIAPIFEDKNGADKIKEGVELEKRKNVLVIIKHWNEDKYYCLDWSKIGWKSFVVGGVENGETYEEAAIREAKEESGYQNIKSIKKIGGEIHGQYFLPHKNVNRYAINECYCIELADEKCVDLDEAETINHKGLWISVDELKNYINLDNHLYYWNLFQNGDHAFVEDGVLTNSGEYTGLSSEQGREEMTKWLEKNKIGFGKINYKLRDWLVSRQRYWGSPIPIIYCEKCGEVPVPEKDLPVVLPDDVDFMPHGESPLARSKSFHDVKCPKCGGTAKRESDTMDTFVCSSWYYFRYADPKNEKEFCSKDKIKKWLPVDLYLGGAEHSVMHLLYARFFAKVLHSLGYIDFDEPFLKLRHQGIILAEDGKKMSKSFGNVVNPDDIIKEYGADALRMFEMFMGPLNESKPWNTKGIIGLCRFLEKVWKLQEKIRDKTESNNSKKILNKTIKKVGEDIEGLNFNTAISSMMILLNEFQKEETISKEDFEKFLIILSPFAPHITEELLNQLGHKESIFKEKWPEYDKKLIKDKTVNLTIQINGKVRDNFEIEADTSEDKAKDLALARDNVKKWTEGKEIRKVIFVPNKLINIVV